MRVFVHSNTESLYSQEAMNDLVTTLPGLNTPITLSNHFSGYLKISSTKFIHYYYAESQSDPTIDKIIFWTNGININFV